MKGDNGRLCAVEPCTFEKNAISACSKPGPLALQASAKQTELQLILCNFGTNLNVLAYITLWV